MIELKGTYYQNITQKPLSVLVQYDGRLLHVWHLTDPFYRLRSGSRFAIGGEKNGLKKVIKFPDGAHIETENSTVLKMLHNDQLQTRTLLRYSTIRNAKIIGVTLLCIMLFWVAWSLAIQ